MKARTSGSMLKTFINHYNTYTHIKANAERVMRSLKEKLLKYFTSYEWIDILPEIVKTYNTSRYRTTRMLPIDIINV